MCLYKESCRVWLAWLLVGFDIVWVQDLVKINQQHWMVPCRAMPTLWIFQTKCQNIYFTGH